MSLTVSATAGATSNLTLGGVTQVGLKNVETFELYTGSGNDSLTTLAGNDRLDAGTGTNTINAGAGDDYITSRAGGIDTVNGGDGADRWDGDYASLTSAVTYTQTADAAFKLTGTAFGTNGTTVQSVETRGVITGSGNDTFNLISSAGTPYTQITAGDGTDTLNLDWSMKTGGVSFSSYNGGSGYTSGSDGAGNGESLAFYGIEQFNLKTGSGDDNIYLYAVLSAAGTVDAGAGADRFYDDLSAATAAVSLTVSATAGATSNLTLGGVTQVGLKNVETFELYTGSGNDSLTTLAGNDRLDAGTGTNTINAGAGDDYITSRAGGIDTINGGDGADRWDGDYASLTSAVTYTQTADAAFKLTGTAFGTTGTTVQSVETRYMTTGSGNDIFNLISSNGTLNTQITAGDGTDTLNLDWSMKTGGVSFSSYSGGSLYASSSDGAGNSENVTFYGIEKLNLKTGLGDDSIYFLFGLSVAGTVDAGNGADRFYGDLSAATAAVSLTVSATAGATSNLTLGGVTQVGLKNVETFELYTGSGNDSLTTLAGNDRLDAGTGTNTINAGAGDDYITSRAGGIDTVNGGDGADRWDGDYASLTSAVTYTQTADAAFKLTGTAFGTNGTAVQSVETRGVITGSGNDTFNLISSAGTPYTQITAGDGTDTLNLDWSTKAGGVYFDFSNGGSGYANSSDGAGNGESLAFYGIENVNLKTGSGDDSIGFSPNLSIVGSVDGGSGNDTVYFNGKREDFKITTSNGSTTVSGVGSDSAFTITTTKVEHLGFADQVYDVPVTTGYNIINGSDTVSDVLNGTAGQDKISGFAGADKLYGNADDDLLYGGAGNDLLDGGTGIDAMYGGAGNDTYIVDATGDKVMESDEATGADTGGVDLVNSSVSFTLSAFVENLTLTGTAATSATGNDLANKLLGNSANNILYGGAGNDALNGGAGADQMYGGSGNDSYTVDNTGDYIYESDDTTGIDSISSSITLDLTDTARVQGAIENLTLSGTAAINGTGNALNNVITGNAYANVLSGGAGNDSLNGGVGSDTLLGGAGNDSYTVDNMGDIVSEETTLGSGVDAGGTDTVSSSVTYTLGSFIEKLTLTGSTAIDGAGNDLNNALVGNTAANVLSGGAGNDSLNGGVGADTLLGGAGNDSYTVDNMGDIVSEETTLGSGVDAGGTDTVSSSVTYTLGSFIETLTLTGSASINGTGNGQNNTLTGNAYANTLSGGDGNDILNGAAGDDILIGGAGNDSLVGGLGADKHLGGAGNDTYTVDNLGDAVSEETALGSGVDAGGTDSVSSTVSFTLGSFIESLTLTGSAVIDGTGNDLNNDITGNAYANILSGGGGNDSLNAGAGNDILIGGAGTDTLTGGAGADQFRFTNANEGGDLILDFTRTQGDKIAVTGTAFGGLTAGSTLPSDWLVNGTAATVSHGQFIYNSTSKQLSFDVDGTGSATAQVLATFSANIGPMATSDFVIM